MADRAKHLQTLGAMSRCDALQRRRLPAQLVQGWRRWGSHAFIAAPG
ncbi:hypothetical protein [Synechococcus sp. LA31]|nr:hypothetical protein [Synechococcus sp. LA31]QVV67911.1 hypothetical protein KJJ24_01535 [Synechococcus sp. LA31]